MIPVCIRCYIEIEYDEINGAVRRLKGGKSPGIDKIAVEYLKKGGKCVLECLMEEKVQREWKSTCIIPLNKG